MAEPVGGMARRGGSASDLEMLESVLRRAKGVTSVTVVLRDGGPVAYVTPAAVDAAALRAHLAANLPGSAVPEFTMVDALPLTADGRVDRAALAAAGLAAAGHTVTTDTGYAGPRTETERVLTRICADVLGVERVGIEDNFFDLAGDSIDTIRLVARAKEAGLHITTQDVFRLKTIAAIAAAARQADPAAGTPDAPSGSPLISLSQQEIDAIEAKWR
jgi:acyl carrier protein/predicted regulator of Ras-like GTPase activity (Roadblock/LC7/MglB family)